MASRETTVLRVVPFEPYHTEQWDDFVWHSNNGTLFHTRAFLSYHPPERFHDDSLLFFKDSTLLAVLPAATKVGDQSSLLRSHPGASFGGFITRSNLSLRDAERLVTHFLAYCREHEYTGAELTSPPQIYSKRPNQHIDFFLYQHGFRYRKREISSVIQLDLLPAQVFELFAPDSRREAQRAQKLGVQARENDDLPAFYDLLKQDLKRHNTQPTHALEELIKLRQIFPERLRLFTAHLENTMIAAILIFVCNSNAALAFYVSHPEAFRHYRGINLLFYEVMRWCAQQGLRFLDLGTTTINMQPNWGLAHFKESFGAQGVLRDTMWLEF
jgi:hypothetical protein